MDQREAKGPGENGKVIHFSPFLTQRYGVSKRRVLIVDDEEDMGLFLGSLLEDHGFLPACAFSAEEALRRIQLCPPDCILLDIMMPGKGGLYLFSKVKSHPMWRNIPVIFVTGIRQKVGGDFSKFLQGLKARVPDGYIEKPIDPEGLIRTICKAMSQGCIE